MLQTVERKSLSDAVFEQLRDRILAGDLEVGEALPSERELCEKLGVNRGAVREALKRLEQARLVAIRHGGATRVLDYRRSAGPELLTSLLFDGEGNVDLKVARSVAEMRAAIAPDIARLAARRADAATGRALEAILAEMEAAPEDLAALQDASIRLWALLVRASDNIAYELVYNSLRQTYDRIRPALQELLAVELRDLAGFRALVRFVARGDAGGAERSARKLLAPSNEAMMRLFEPGPDRAPEGDA